MFNFISDPLKDIFNHRSRQTLDKIKSDAEELAAFTGVTEPEFNYIDLRFNQIISMPHTGSFYTIFNCICDNCKNTWESTILDFKYDEDLNIFQIFCNDKRCFSPPKSVFNLPTFREINKRILSEMGMS